MRKMFYAFVVLLITSAVFIACSKQENENLDKPSSLKIEGKVAFDKKTKKVIIKEINDVKHLSLSKVSDTLNYTSLKYIFTCDKSMPIFNSQENLEQYLIKNTSKTNGIFEFFIDDKLAYSVQIVNGVKEKVIFMETLTEEGKRYPCSYAGIRACAVDGIHSQNWYDMTVCVLDGFGCVVNWYASCFASNC